MKEMLCLSEDDIREDLTIEKICKALSNYHSFFFEPVLHIENSNVFADLIFHPEMTDIKL